VMMMREWLQQTGEMRVEADVWPRVLGKAQPADVTAVGERLERDVAALPRLGLASPRSRCGACGHAIRWYENIPVLSWLVLRGRCSACKTPISVRYPLIELLTGGLFALAAWRFGPHPVTLAWCAAIAALVAMAFIDLDTQYLPDDITLPLLWGGLLVSALGWTLPLPTALWGVVAGYVPLWLVAKGFQVLRGKEGMGLGDLKLLAALGAWLGWQAILPVILMASIVGLLVNVPLALLRRESGQRYPFGPFLAAGGLVVMFVGADALYEWAGINLTA